METSELATEATKTGLENSVSWFLADKMRDASTPIAAKKYLTNDNVLVYLTRCIIESASVPRVKVQVFKRVQGGVQETGFQIFSDHRMVKYENAMIFGTKPGTPAGTETQDVSEAEAKQLLNLVNNLAQARQTL